MSKVVYCKLLRKSDGQEVGARNEYMIFKILGWTLQQFGLVLDAMMVEVSNVNKPDPQAELIRSARHKRGSSATGVLYHA
jgi:hypothetical protein